MTRTALVTRGLRRRYGVRPLPDGRGTEQRRARPFRTTSVSDWPSCHLRLPDAQPSAGRREAAPIGYAHCMSGQVIDQLRVQEITEFYEPHPQKRGSYASVPRWGRINLSARGKRPGEEVSTPPCYSALIAPPTPPNDRLPRYSLWRRRPRPRPRSAHPRSRVPCPSPANRPRACSRQLTREKDETHEKKLAKRTQKTALALLKTRLRPKNEPNRTHHKPRQTHPTA